MAHTKISNEIHTTQTFLMVQFSKSTQNILENIVGLAWVKQIANAVEKCHLKYTYFRRDIKISITWGLGKGILEEDRGWEISRVLRKSWRRDFIYLVPLNQ